MKTETGSTAKDSAVSLYRKSDIAEAKISQQPKPTHGSSKSPSAKPRKNLQKISSMERLEESDPDEELQRQAQQADRRAKISQQPKPTHGSSKSPSAKPRKNLQKISSMERLEESDPDEELQRQAQQVIPNRAFSTEPHCRNLKRY